jgi:hypothetical protein
MPYDYESLLDEQFQQFCQALLTKEFASLQCMPVGMPDGGRDATAADGNGGLRRSVQHRHFATALRVSLLGFSSQVFLAAVR